MLRMSLLALLMLDAPMAADPKQAEVTEMIVQNVRDHSPACKVQIKSAGEKCADSTCVLPTLRKTSAEPLSVRFSCIRTEDKTGFENPAPEMKYFFVHYRSGTGHMGVLDAMSLPGETAMQEIFFCLFGNSNILCGRSEIRKVKGKLTPEVGRLRSFIKRIDFTATAIGADQPE